MTSTAEAEHALLAAHENLAVLKLYISGHHATNSSLSTNAHARDGIIDAFMSYVRSTVTAVAHGTLPGISADAPNGSSRYTSEGSGQLSQLVGMLCGELEVERRERAFAADALHKFNATMLDFRLEDDVTQVYKHRIVELQAVINGTKRPQDIRSDVGVKPPVVPTGLNVTEEQKRLEACNALSRLTNQMKDKMERLRAENMKLLGDKSVLVGENKLLADRVKVLETQLAIMSASSSVNLRELNKQRTLTARLASAKDNAHQRQQQHQLQPGECVVGGVVMDKEVAMWLHDVYNALLANPGAAETLQNLRGGSGHRDGTVGSISAVGAASDEASSAHQSSKRTPSASTRDTTSRPASRPVSRPASSGTVPSYGQTRGYTQSFTEYISDPEPETVE